MDLLSKDMAAYLEKKRQLNEAIDAEPGDGAVFVVTKIDEQGSGMDFGGHLGSTVRKARACCENCSIIFGWMDGYVSETVGFTPEELTPQNDLAKNLLAERLRPRS